MFFKDREEAARLLAKRLSRYRGRRPLVLGIPRGSVPMAALVSEELEGDLDVVLVHKLGAPGNPEYAIGAISEFGDVWLNEEAGEVRSESEYLEREKKEELKLLRARRRAYGEASTPIDPMGRIVVIVDDGIATGSTMLAAVRSLKARKPERVIVAAPVASESAAARLREVADELEILFVPEVFFAVGEFYEDFRQVTDEEVLEALRIGRERASRGAA